MRIKQVQSEPVELIPYIAAAPGGQGTVYTRLPVHFGAMERLPAEIDALIVTSDLQGVVEEASGRKLLGETVPELLQMLLRIEKPDVDPGRTVVLLCGDLYADPDKRGSSGNPVAVWTAFRRAFGTVAGVAGNHDLFDAEARRSLAQSEGVCFFGEPGIRRMAGITIAGLGGITGRADKPNRMPENDYLAALNRLLRSKPDVLLLHQGPDGTLPGQSGHTGIREALAAAEGTLVCCGHIHWDLPGATFSNGTQIWNADGKVFIFTR